MTNNKKPIQEPADMQGLKIRVQQSKVYIEMMKSSRHRHTIAFTELYSALQQGSWTARRTHRHHPLHELLRGAEEPLAHLPHLHPGAVMISPKLWNSLTAEQKAILQKSVNEAAQSQRKAVADKEADDLAFLKSKGMAVVEKPNAEAFRKATQPVYAAWPMWSRRHGGQGTGSKINASAARVYFNLRP